jgi:hypothetical protein
VNPLRPPRFLGLTLLGAAGLLAAIALGNWRIDPLQHYRPAGYPPLLVEPSRFRNPGLARHFTGNAVVMGTSLSREFTPADIRAEFGWEPLNLAMEGASAHEQFLLLRLALRTGRVRDVIWDVHYEFLRGSPDWVSDFDGSFPAYLYDDGPLNDLLDYLWNIDTCKNSLRVLLGRYPRRQPEEFSAEPPGVQYGPEAVRRGWKRMWARRSVLDAQMPAYAGDQLENSFKANFLSLIREHPEVRFHLYFPPFSSAYYGFLRVAEPQMIDVLLINRAEVWALTGGLPNVELHDLQDVREITDDLRAYRDLTHFDSLTHRRVLALLHARQHLASEKTLEAFALRMSRLQAAPPPNTPP